MSFADDMREMKAAIRTNLENGMGSRSVEADIEQMKQRPPKKAEKPNRHLVRTFLISAFFGAVWQSLRRRR